MELENEIPNDLSDLRYKIRNSMNGTNKVMLGKFILLQRLGGGNYGDVYLAVHSENQKNFAIKIIDKKALFDKNRDPYVREVLTRLLKSEGILMQMCDSPHVIKCYDTVENNKYKIFVLEYCNRGTLHDELKKKKAYPINDALAILKQIILGLSELHKKSIVHRDLKAQNIMMHNSKFKIADFGFSKKLDNENVIGNFTVLGTKTTMAPEVRANEKYGIKADIWSLGIIFYTMICSNIEYDAESYIARPRDIHQQIFKGKDLTFMTVDGKPDEELKQFLKSMLTIDQKKRISWKELINHKILERTNSSLLSDVIHNVSLGALVSQFSKDIDEEKNLEDYEKQLPTEITEDVSKYTKKTEISDSVRLDEVIQKELNETIDINVAPVSSMTEFNNLKKSDLEKQLFKLIKLNNLECHKAQFILEKIIMEIEKREMLDFQRRSHNELLYLMITRCWINVSWAANNLELNSNDDMLVNYHAQVKTLYSKVKAKWDKIEKDLRAVEDLRKYKLMDGLDTVFSREKKKNREKFFQGIETDSYTKEQQIEHTQNEYIEKIIEELKGQPSDFYEMKLKLQCYKKINEISLEELEEKGQSFHERVRKILAH